MNKPKFVNLIKSHNILAELHYKKGPITRTLSSDTIYNCYYFNQSVIQKVITGKIDWPYYTKLTYEKWFIYET